MLRIGIQDLGMVCRLELAGRLEGPWVGETEHAWRSLLRPDKQIEVDLRQLTGMDDSGRELLSAMYQAEVSLIGEGVWMTALIEELTAENHFNTGTRQPPRKKLPRKPISRQQESSN
jgi:hypothetical protein